MQRLQGKVTLITGGGTGIGRACALEFAREGALVAVVGRRSEPLNAVAREISDMGGEALALTCDVTGRQSVETAIAAVAGRFGRLDVLINNAGGVVVAAVDETSDEDWNRLIAVNLTGTFYMSRAALPEFRKAGKGVIVNVGSALGIVGRQKRAAYCAAKGGVTMLTKAMALDHAHENIRVNCICPSIVTTEMGLSSLAPEKDWEAERQKRAAEIPLGRMGEPEDVAHLAVYLASDESAWVTGIIFPLDGGLTAK